MSRGDPVNRLRKVLKQHPSVNENVCIDADYDMINDIWTVNIKGAVSEWIAVTSTVLTMPSVKGIVLILNSKILDLS